MMYLSHSGPAVLSALAFALALPGSPLSAQDGGPVAADPRVAEAVTVVETWLEAQRAYEQIPGISAAIIADEEIVWTGAFGYAHPSTGVRATPATMYSICSISKLFTGIAVMQLRDGGHLRLSDRVSEHLDWYTMAGAGEEAPPVTIEGLLTHASGLPRESDHAYWSQPYFRFPTREEIIEGFERQEPLYPAWSRYQYSNLGITLAGEIVRERSGMSFEEYVQQRILTPLGLNDTRTEMPEDERNGRLATGYSALTRDGDRKPMPFFTARGINPAAGFASTAEDMARFAAWQMGITVDDPVLHAHTLQEMQRVHYVDQGFDLYRGLAFGVYRHNGRTYIGHSGSCPGYQTELLIDPERRIGVVFMANASGVNTRKFTTRVFDLVADAVLAARSSGGASGGEADEPAAPGPELDDYRGTYDVQPWGGEAAVVRWKGGLALLHLPTDNPARALTRLAHVEGDTFRRILNDRERGETVTFLRDEDGRVTGYRQYENVYRRIR